MTTAGGLPPRYRTALRQVRGLGSARSGTDHFWRQRLTAVANVPLVIAFVLIVVLLMGRNHAAAVQIIGSPVVAIILLLFVASVTYHMRLGMQVIIEDYVHQDLPKLVLLIANTFFTAAVAFGCGYAILKLSFGV
ncbi:MAG: succinate dehydrogenase, hydrophobic membrane anchor protein [Rhizobiales bacterium]|nr:succinate dehydrogenase, hydrophobic membrane anchor protein [Hyphomicrobiales bacterium]